MALSKNKVKKTYGQFCGVAKSLDMLGERWTLLIARELVCGPRRYSDIALALDGITTNLLAKRLGLACRFREDQVRSMGRATAGVVSTKLLGDDEVVGMAVVDSGAVLLSVTENGYGKRSSIEDYRMTSRGTKGVINIKTTERNGHVVAILDVKDSDQIMMMTKNGIIIRCPINQIRVMGRATQGVRLIDLDEGDRVVDVARLAVEDEEG